MGIVAKIGPRAPKQILQPWSTRFRSAKNDPRQENLIYRCPDDHISFAKDLRYCGMKGCQQPVEPISEMDIDWFYKISASGLTIHKRDLHMIIRDKNMPGETKKAIAEIFPELKKSKKGFWFH